jgi:hypothetical protein
MTKVEEYRARARECELALRPRRLGHRWPSQTGTNMLETYFSASKMLGHLRSGPSGPYLDGFAAALERRGYSVGTAVRYLRAAAHLGHVVARQGAMPSDIDLAVFSEHLRTCRCPRVMGGRRNHHTIFGAGLFRQHLVEIGVCRSAAAALQPAEPCLVAHFKVWLRKHRGAADPTIKLYARDAAHLIAALGDDPKKGASMRCSLPTRSTPTAAMPQFPTPAADLCDRPSGSEDPGRFSLMLHMLHKMPLFGDHKVADRGSA